MTGQLAGRQIKPMKAVSGDLPVGDGWVYELKWDGMRIVCFLDDDGMRLQSANLLDVTASFPELHAIADAFSHFDSLILDGEVVAMGEDGRPDFGRLQKRMHVTDPGEAARRAATTPVTYVVFDILHLNGSDTSRLPFDDRRRLLEQVVTAGSNWLLTDIYRDGGRELLDTVTTQGLEGLIAKQSGSRYVEGKRSSSWRKIKPRRRQEFVVGGWVEGRQGRAGSIGSLLVGYYDGGRLRSAGSVGSGLGSDELSEWKERVAEFAVETSPFDVEPQPTQGRRFHWIEPAFVVEVEFGDWTADGNLRHPSYLGLRNDKDPTDVVREP